MSSSLAFKTSIKIQHIDDRKIDAWKCTEEVEPTPVHIDDTNVVRLDLRSSQRIKHKFQLKIIPVQLAEYFTDIAVGIGSKHMYVEGDFMKEHTDLRLPNIALPEHNSKPYHKQVQFTTHFDFDYDRQEMQPENTSELPHIMTLVITDTLSHFKLDG